MSKPKITLIGDVLVDVTLPRPDQPLKMRLGGIVHAARGLWSADIPYGVGYFAPSYLDAQINHYLRELGCDEIIKLGDVIGSPYVFLITEAKEIADQGYEFLLRDEVHIIYDDEAIKNLSNNGCEDYLIISGNYSAERMINQIDRNVHIDLANNVDDLSYLRNKKVKTIFISTSSTIFKQTYSDNFLAFCSRFENFTETIILKENRGGSRGYNFLNKYNSPRNSGSRLNYIFV